MITLSLFGVPDVRNDVGDRAYTVLAQAKHVAFLAYLARARLAPVRREQVVAMLWPDLDVDRARNALSKAIHNCRRALGDQVLVGRFAEEIGLDASQWSCDVWTFDDALKHGDLERALEHYQRGEFLDGLVIADASGLEQWVDEERSRLRRLAIDATWTLVDAAEQRGDLSTSLSHLRHASALSPLDERIARRQMELMDRTGDRAGALELYREHAARLSRELETQPSPETQAQIEAMRRRSAVRLAAIVVASTTAVTPSPLRSPDALRNGHESHRDFADGALPIPAHTSSVIPAAHEAARVSPNALRRRRISMLVAAAVVVVVIASIAVDRRDAHSNAESLPARVLVVPFEDHSNDSTLVAVGEMAADLLSAALSRAGVADVVDSRTRIRKGFTVADRERSADSERLAEIARTSGISTIVTGSYYVTNGALTITAQVRGLSGATVPQRFVEETGPSADPREVIRKVEQRLMGVFATIRDRRLIASTTATSAAPTLAAYTEYVAGLAQWTHGDPRAAASHFERAFQLDSTFVSVLPWLIESLSNTGEGARADSIVANLGQRRQLLSAYDQALLDWCVAWNAGERDVMYDAAQRMVRLAPRSSDAQWLLGFSATTTNRFTVAIDAFGKAELEEGFTRDKWFSALQWQTTAYHMLGRHNEALDVVRRFQARHPETIESCSFRLRALTLTIAIAELNPQITACADAQADKDSLMPASLRLILANELRFHDRPDDARLVALPAIAWLRAKLAKAPASRMLRESLGTALMTINAWPEAESILLPLARALPTNIPPRFASNAGIAAFHAGHPAIAEEMLTRLRATSPTNMFYLQRARLLAHMGRRDDAVAELRTMIARGLSAVELLHANIGVEPLRGFPPFEALVRPRS